MTKAGTGWKRTTETCSGGPAGANEIRDWVEKGPIARGLAAQPPQWPCSLPYVEEKNILHIFWRLFFFCVWEESGFRNDIVVCQRTLAVESGQRERSWMSMETHSLAGLWRQREILMDDKTLRAVLHSNFIFLHTL